jgi:hypothetical protein
MSGPCRGPSRPPVWLAQRQVLARLIRTLGRRPRGVRAEGRRGNAGTGPCDAAAGPRWRGANEVLRGWWTISLSRIEAVKVFSSE